MVIQYVAHVVDVDVVSTCRRRYVVPRRRRLDVDVDVDVDVDIDVDINFEVLNNDFTE